MLSYQMLPDNKRVENEKAIVPKVLEFVRQLKIGLIYGPISPEDHPYYRRALLSGPAKGMSVTSVASTLAEEGFSIEIINPDLFGFIDRLKNIDFALIMIHGPHGEDGKMQGLLDYLRIPYLGPSVLPSAICNSKTTCKTMVRSLGISTPSSTTLLPRSAKAIGDLISSSGLTFPVMLKGDTGGSSVGMAQCNNVDEVVSRISTVDPKTPYFCESFVKGRVCTVSLIQLGTEMFCTEPIEVETERAFYDEISKLEGGSSGAAVRFHCPARLSKLAAEKCMKDARSIAEQLQLTVHGRVDFIVSDDESAHFLEVNTLPSLSSAATFAKGGLTLGFSYPELLLLLIRASLINEIDAVYSGQYERAL
ncbi:hypothetical protein [Bradyrhizobium sp. CCBAU 53421]|uniref:D-alanine--D-alanine ligase family protein n=1 Tax=Bradyrhizobium sp. CCBAU 53421 TaxID=1325120 RepID=UPI00188B7247|nr:hypothetical protein [Bradyrhizobium sp. CCBAU 53421]QOZ33226.1 hypothetical protein XH92_17375 [Bradyrhizobium sp. CCBAU 53421]